MTTFHFFMTEQCSSVYPDCIFIYSADNGHSGWLYILAIVNSAAISMVEQVSLILCLLDLYPLMRWLGHVTAPLVVI